MVRGVPGDERFDVGPGFVVEAPGCFPHVFQDVPL